jgi:hypothetical protein
MEGQMRKAIIAGAIALSLTAAPAFLSAAQAAQPAQPGCFGRDRAAVLHQMQDNSYAGLPAQPGASEWGQIAADRAGDNGQINRDYNCQP